MADVASLGIQVSTNGTQNATSELNKLSGAAARAESATDGLSEANRGATGAAATAAQAYANEGAAAASTSKQIEMMNRAANQNSVAAKSSSLQMRMVAMQLSQVAQQTQASGNFLQALAIQLPDLALGFGTVGIAIGVLLGVLLPLIPAGKYVASGLRLIADNLEAIAPYAIGAAAALALLYAPAIIAGLTLVSEAILGITARLIGLAIGFAAANPAVAFVIGITAAVAAANIFRDELTNIFGVDVVGAAKRGVNFIINSFEAAYEDIKFVWNNLSSIVGAAAIGAANAVIDAVNHMINGAKMGVNDLIAAINKIPGVNIDALDTSGGTIPRIPNTYAADLEKAAKGRNANLERIMGQDRLGQFGEAITNGASAASEKLKELAGWIGKVDDKTKKKHGKTEVEKYDDIVDGANRRIASLQAEQDALGLTELAAAKLKYETQLLNEAQQRGITLTASQKTELSGLADRMASIEIATKNAREAMDFAKDSTRGFLDDLRTGLQNGEGLWKSFGNAALGVLDKIVSKINDQLVDAIFSASGAGSGGGGFWSSLLGIFGGGGASQLSIAQAGGVGLYAAGTPAARPGVAWVGEKGPELVRFKGGEEVIPNHRLQAPANQNASASSAGTVNAPVSITIDARGADAEGLSRVEQQIAKLKAELPGTIVATVNSSTRRRLIK